MGRLNRFTEEEKQKAGGLFNLYASENTARLTAEERLKAKGSPLLDNIGKGDYLSELYREIEPELDFYEKESWRFAALYVVLTVLIAPVRLGYVITGKLIMRNYFTNAADTELRLAEKYRNIGHDLEFYYGEDMENSAGRVVSVVDYKRKLVLAMFQKAVTGVDLSMSLDDYLDEVKKEIMSDRGAKCICELFYTIFEAGTSLCDQIILDYRWVKVLDHMERVRAWERSGEVLKKKPDAKVVSTYNNEIGRIKRIRVRLVARIASLYYSLRKVDRVIRGRLTFLVDWIGIIIFENGFDSIIRRAFGVPIETMKLIPFDIKFFSQKDRECLAYMRRSWADELQMKMGLKSRIYETDVTHEDDQLLTWISRLNNRL